MSEKINNSIKNYKSALKKLHEFIDEPIVNDRDRAGIIQAFEFTFEQAWRTLQKIAKDEGLEAGGPRTSLKQGFQLNYIENQYEQTWLDILEDRNLMSHTYREALSTAICEKVQNKYLLIFDELLKKLETKI